MGRNSPGRIRYRCITCNEMKARDEGDNCGPCQEEADKNQFQIGYSGEQVDCEKYILRELDGCDYGRGEIETLRAASGNHERVLARLVAKLFENGVLSKEDVLEL